MATVSSSVTLGPDVSRYGGGLLGVAVTGVYLAHIVRMSELAGAGQVTEDLVQQFANLMLSCVLVTVPKTTSSAIDR